MAKIYDIKTKEMLADLSVDQDYVVMKAMEQQGLGKMQFNEEIQSEVFVWNELV